MPAKKAKPRIKATKMWVRMYGNRPDLGFIGKGLATDGFSEVRGGWWIPDAHYSDMQRDAKAWRAFRMQTSDSGREQIWKSSPPTRRGAR